MSNEKLRFYGWTHTNHELARLQELHRLGLVKLVTIWVQCSNGNTTTGTLVFDKCNREQLTLKSKSEGEVVIGCYRISEIVHDYVPTVQAQTLRKC